MASVDISGNLLRVDLASETFRTERLPEEVIRKYLGGRGLGAKILFEELKPGLDPLGPDNKLVFAVGPVTGAPFGGNSRFTVMAKSPLTGGWGESSGGGFFGAELRFAGLYAVVVENMAESPVYVWIKDGQVEIHKAEYLWGKDPIQSIERIKSEVGETARVACIGMAGENQVRYACVTADVRYAAGRCGMGAVMGSKKLKALAVRGTGKVQLADKESFLDLKQKHADQSWAGLGKLMYDYGEDGFLDDLNASGRLPTKGFQRGTFEHAEALTGETMSKTMLVGRQTCFACRNSCYRVVKGEDPYSIDSEWGGPEYESVAALGSLCLVGDLNAVCKANELCNKYTLDTISTGVVVAFAMECYEKGFLTSKDADGLELTWGNHSAELQLIEKIARREGIGDLLAEGVARAAQKIGGGVEKFALTIKGQELPMHEPRGKKGVGLSYAVSNRGACHLQMIEQDDAWEVPQNMVPEVGLVKPTDRLDTSIDKVRLVKAAEDFKSMVDSLTLCIIDSFPAGPAPDVIFGLVNSVTGWNMRPAELAKIGERAFNLCRAFNIREGFSRKDDTLPERLMEPLPDGPYKGQRITYEELQLMLDNYYAIRGWDRNGIPTPMKLGELGLDFVAEQLRVLGNSMTSPTYFDLKQG
jgi:aldehyde:ferredoxin oxidoreductase